MILGGYFDSDSKEKEEDEYFHSVSLKYIPKYRTTRDGSCTQATSGENGQRQKYMLFSLTWAVFFVINIIVQ